MMRFFASLAFAAVASLAAVPWMLLTSPIIGRVDAGTLFGLAALVAYAAVIAPTWRHAAVAFALSLGLTAGAGVLGLVTGSAAAALVAGAVGLSVVRSGFIHRSRPLRALVLEGGLLFGGALAARLLMSGSPFDPALGTWAFFLVQSLFFVVGGVETRTPEEPASDPFEQAQRKALALLEGGV